MENPPGPSPTGSHGICIWLAFSKFCQDNKAEWTTTRVRWRGRKRYGHPGGGDLAQLVGGHGWNPLRFESYVRDRIQLDRLAPGLTVVERARVEDIAVIRAGAFSHIRLMDDAGRTDR